VSAPETTPESVSSTDTTGATGENGHPTPRPAPKPVAPKAVAAPEPEFGALTGSSPARRVVVAEDEALIRLDIVEMLREGGFDVVGEAGDGEQAVQLAEELKPDLVVLDVKMPVLDGISAAERIVGARIAPVVLLTAFSQRELVERARDAGAMAYVVKPFTSADLMPALEIALSRHAEIAALESEVADLQQRFETRKVVDRAKGLLQTRFGMTEPEAFRWIQKTSMDKRLTMREVAQAVIGAGDEKPSA
jgi:AmiR/NasT family two-component response regulator